VLFGLAIKIVGKFVFNLTNFLLIQLKDLSQGSRYFHQSLFALFEDLDIWCQQLA
jgi:hypothetical protein